MNRLAAAFAERPEAREHVRRTLDGAATVAAGGFAAAWLPAAAVATAEHGLVTCVVARVPGTGGTSTTALDVARAYADERLDLDALRGGFTVLLWDEGRRRGLVAADQLGVLAPVYRRSGDELLVALEVRDLLPLLSRAPGPDPRSLVRWLGSGSIDPDATLYAGVERLPGGHTLRFAHGRWSRSRYRRFEYRGTLKAPREHLEREVRDALERAVARRIDDAGSTGVLLSGGLDSAVVAATAAGSGHRLPSYSLVFPGHREVDESALIATVAAELGLQSTVVPFRGGHLLADAAAYIEEWELPPASPTLAVQLPLLRRAREAGATRLLDGQGGDELFGTPLYVLADRLVRGRLPRAWALARRIPGVPEHARSAVARRALREFGLKGALPHRAHALGRRLPGRGASWAPPWLTPAAASSYRAGWDPWAWKQAGGPRWWSGLLDSVTEQRERAGAHDYLRRRNALAGVEGGHALLQDLDLIELVLRLPPTLAFDSTYDRPLLRSAIPAVPQAIRTRTEKAFFTPLFVEAVDVHDAAEIRRLVGAENAFVREYAQPELVRRHLLDAQPGRRGEATAWALWRLAVVELWLRRLSDR